jgi:sulfotransferase famil protein
MSLPKRIVHLHIPKTAGTSLRHALKKSYGESLRVFPHYDERKYVDFNVADYDLYSGHFGFRTASRIGGELITVFRHPTDRFVSVYYFWRQLHERGVERSKNTTLASKYSLDDFAMIKDEPLLLEEFHNRMTWQIAFGSQLEYRREWRMEGKTDDELLKTAISNLSAFSIIGNQERLGEFRKAVAEKLSIDLEIEKMNVTQQRSNLADINARTLRAIQDWVSMDLELYRHVTSCC